jgi:LacI family transcriptional regulator
VDNDSLLCDLASPPLSSVAFNAERGGYEAAALLDRMMSGRVKKPTRIVVEPLYVVSRHSTDVLALDDPDVNTAMRFIRNHAGERIRVRDVAACVGLSRRTLEVRFQKALGRSLNAEIQRVRLEKAKIMLAETEWPLAKVAASTGYTDASYLHQIFKRQLGMTPAKYRRSMRVP